MIEFQREIKRGRFLDPRNEFKETTVDSEIRTDPLTGATGRICHFAFSSGPPGDLDAILEKSLEFCPFCPDKVRDITPRFPADMIPEGRLDHGQAVLFPNLFPYDDLSAISVISEGHFHPMDDIPEAVIADGLSVAREFYRRVEDGGMAAPDSYGIVTWNYMPPSGGSQIHPHMQVIHTSNPGNGPRRLLAAAGEWLERHGDPYVEALIEEEQRRGERWIGGGQRVAWLVPFVPTAVLGDCIGVFRGRATIGELTDDDIAEFATGLRRILKGFAEKGLWSFNLVFIPDHGPNGRHWLTARLVPRLYINPALHVTDVAYMQLVLSERFAMTYPEDIATHLRSAWNK